MNYLKHEPWKSLGLATTRRDHWKRSGRLRTELRASPQVFTFLRIRTWMQSSNKAVPIGTLVPDCVELAELEGLSARTLGWSATSRRPPPFFALGVLQPVATHHVRYIFHGCRPDEPRRLDSHNQRRRHRARPVVDGTRQRSSLLARTRPGP